MEQVGDIYMARATRAAGSQQIITSNIWCINCTAPTWFIAQIVKKYSKCTFCNILDTLCKICTNCTKFAQIVQNVHILKSVEHHIGPKLKWQRKTFIFVQKKQWYWRNECWQIFEDWQIWKKCFLTDIWRVAFDKYGRDAFWQIWQRCFAVSLFSAFQFQLVKSGNFCNFSGHLKYLRRKLTIDQHFIGSELLILLFGFPHLLLFHFSGALCNPLVRTQNSGQDPQNLIWNS